MLQIKTCGHKTSETMKPKIRCQRCNNTREDNRAPKYCDRCGGLMFFLRLF